MFSCLYKDIYRLDIWGSELSSAYRRCRDISIINVGLVWGVNLLYLFLKSTYKWYHKFGLGVQNEVGQRPTVFCQVSALIIANTLFQQHKRRLYIWRKGDRTSSVAISADHQTEIYSSFLPHPFVLSSILRVCAQLCPILCDPMVRSLPGSSIHGIFHVKFLG